MQYPCCRWSMWCIGMTLSLALHISSAETQQMTAISHTDFLMCCPTAQRTDVISGSPDVDMKLATMSAWKHLSVWLIYQTEVKYLTREHLVSCLHKASISYLIHITEDGHLHSNIVTYQRKSRSWCPVLYHSPGVTRPVVPLTELSSWSSWFQYNTCSKDVNESFLQFVLFMLLRNMLNWEQFISFTSKVKGEWTNCWFHLKDSWGLQPDWSLRCCRCLKESEMYLNKQLISKTVFFPKPGMEGLLLTLFQLVEFPADIPGISSIV